MTARLRFLQGGVLNVTDVKRADSGSYTVEAGNKEGKTNFTFVLNVQCECPDPSGLGLLPVGLKTA